MNNTKLKGRPPGFLAFANNLSNPIDLKVYVISISTNCIFSAVLSSGPISLVCSKRQ